ncbi:DNA mismatch repair protein [Halobacteriales archaeon QS_8_69_26]|nr:MAG: DNA mismatch repair protein [Halobacteriales archaeon QS_8_69_26]
MRLENYWGVGPKTSALLSEELGVGTAVEAIESADVRALTDAGLGRGRATRILRHAKGEAGMDLLATRDARSVYKDLVDLAADYAVTRRAADRIRVLTPLADRADMDDRLDEVDLARESWEGLDGPTREAVLAAFEAYDESEGGDLAAVEAALALREAGVEGGVFESVTDLDGDLLRAGAEALRALGGDADGEVADGADDRLDDLRATLRAVDDLAGRPAAVVEEVGGAGAADPERFRTALRRHVVEETGVDAARLREAAPGDAADATDFVSRTLRGLVEDLSAAVEDREAEVRERLADTLDESREEVAAADAAVDDATFLLSLGRFAAAFDLTRPTYVEDRDALAVLEARNLALAAGDGDVQPVSYGIGDHSLSGTTPSRPPSGDRVTVVTGANSGGKTTLLETLCQVALLAHMGLPVPAEAAEVSLVDAVVFHRRHASFNAGVLESTLRTIVPPLTERDRTLMLVDEFEAITEPGRAADLLHGLVTLTVDRESLGAFVTHLADDLEPLPEAARTDGIFAQGLDQDLQLEVDYQPRFGTVGKSTPEFIVSRLLADSDTSQERAGFEALARAVGETAVQRTLTDADWAE